MAEQKTTIQWLTDLSQGTMSTGSDDVKMQNLLRRVSFNNAVVTCGIVYLEGQGTMEAPPTSIIEIAKYMVNVLGSLAIGGLVI